MKEKQISDIALRYVTYTIVSGMVRVTDKDKELFKWIGKTYPDLRAIHNYLYIELGI